MDETQGSTTDPVPPMSPSSAEPKPKRDDTIGVLEATVGVVTSPRATFQRIARSRWLWLFPFVVLLLSAAGQYISFYMRADIGVVMREQMKMTRTFSPDQAAAQQAQVEKLEEMAEQSKFKVALLMSATPLITVVLWFFVAGLLYWVSFLAVGDDLGYIGALQAVGWCSIPTVLKNLLGILIVFLKDPSYTPVQNIVLSNPSAFLSMGDTRGWLYALLSFMDLFFIWKLVLYFSAFPALAKASRSHTAIVVFAWLIVGMTISVIAAAFFIR